MSGTNSESPESAPREAFARKVRRATLYVNKIVKHSDGYPVHFSEADIRTLLVNAFIQGMDEAAKPSPAEPSATLEKLAEALRAWAAFDSESTDLNPCPDLTLRHYHRLRARVLTAAALRSEVHHDR